MKSMKIEMSDLKFDGRDQILVFDFLYRLVTEENMLGMSEAQVFVALPNFLQGFALQQCRGVSGSLTVEEGGVTKWPEAVQ